ncbi:MAG: hypothetical protein ISR45_03620 [Rhodospirillales bacterium]|nr:hypothetical protein [Rhodospirillales bacterium]
MALGGTKESKPSRLDAARERFDAAMQRLDKALETQGGYSGGVDVEKMSAQSAALQAENEELTKINRAVGERLDGAIKRLKNVLESA